MYRSVNKSAIDCYGLHALNNTWYITTLYNYEPITMLIRYSMLLHPQQQTMTFLSEPDALIMHSMLSRRYRMPQDLFLRNHPALSFWRSVWMIRYSSSSPLQPPCSRGPMDSVQEIDTDISQYFWDILVIRKWRHSDWELVSNLPEVHWDRCFPLYRYWGDRSIPSTTFP